VLFGVRLLQVNAGLALFAVGIALMLRAGIGLGPWDVFHQGLSLRTPLTVGQAMIVAGVTLLLLSMALAKVRPGWATLLNMLLIGSWVDLFLGLPGFPEARHWWEGGVMFAVGMVLNGVATGMYITGGLGAGPRDGFALALAKLLGVTVRRARTLVEVVVLSSGWLLGGSVGVGTVAFALAIGPLMQWGLRLFQGVEAAYARFSHHLIRATPVVAAPVVATPAVATPAVAPPATPEG
jgi:uncharacterized membrane protein YczE